jgi:polar amino acid transport system substrate-binding protein
MRKSRLCSLVCADVIITFFSLLSNIADRIFDRESAFGLDGTKMKNRRDNRYHGLLALAALFVFFLLTGCSSDEGKLLPADPSRMNAPEYSIGVPQGAASMTAIEKNFPKSRIEYYASLSDGYMAVKYGKIDAFSFDRHTLRYVTLQNPDLALMDEKIADEFIVVGSAIGREALISKVNAFIAQYRADGTYQDMYNRWLLGKNMKMPELPEPKNPAMTLKIGTEGLDEPMNYYADGKLTGFDIEFVKRLALFLNAKVTFHSMDFPALIASAESGKIDLLVANLNAVPERKQHMLFSDTYVDSEISLLVRKDRLPKKKDEGRITELSQLKGKKVGILTGSVYDAMLKKQIPSAVPEYFNNVTDQTAALKAGKITAFLVDEPMARDIANNTSGVTWLKKMLSSDGYAFAFSKKQVELQKQVNIALDELKKNGALKKLDTKWFGKDESAKVLQDIKIEGRNGVIRLATSSHSAPFVYVKDGKILGYDIEIAQMIAAKLDRKLEVMDMDFAAIIPALMSDKADMAGACITVTEERAESVLFSVPDYSGGVVVMVADSPDGKGSDSFYAGLAESFSRTFITENRYKMVLQGLYVTILITVISAIFGALLGFAVCLMRMSKNRWANIPARVFIRSIQGTPIVVLLMILYYIVFGSMDINGILVAIIGFSVNFAAYVSEMMRTGIEAVDKGQLEAASAIGFNRVQVFTKITFPQAARHALPVFKGEFISMLKMTSIVGYIAIQDLTKMSDIIRSRTYEAFFPLIATALIYFVIAYALASLLSLLELKIDPKKRKREVKGVALK